MSFHKLFIMPAAVGSFFFVLQIYSCSHIIDMFAYTESLSYRNLAHDNQFILKKKNKSVLLVVLWQWYAFRVLFTCIQVKFMSLFLFCCLLLRSQTAPRFQHTWLPHRSCQCLGREPVAWFGELLLFWMPKFKYKQCSLNVRSGNLTE